MGSKVKKAGTKARSDEGTKGKVLTMDQGLSRLRDLGWKLGRPVNDLEREIREIEQKLAETKKRRDFEAQKAAKVCQLMLGADLAAAMAMRPYDAGLKKLLEKIGGWTKFVQDGATDQQIKDRLAKGWSEWSHGYPGETKGRGGYDPCVWIEANDHKPTLQGAKLIAEVRRVLGIPQSAAAAKGKPAAKTGKKTPTVKQANAAWNKKGTSPAPAKTKSTTSSRDYSRWVDGVRKAMKRAEKTLDAASTLQLRSLHDRGKTPAEAAKLMNGDTGTGGRGDAEKKSMPLPVIDAKPATAAAASVKPLKGELGEQFGLKAEDLRRAYVGDKVSFHAFGQREKDIKSVKPVELNGRKWVVLGSEYPPDDSERHEIRPLCTTEDFKSKSFPAGDGYTGAKVKVGREVMVIGPKSEQRAILFKAKGKSAKGNIHGDAGPLAEALLGDLPKDVRQYLAEIPVQEEKLYALKLWRYRTAKKLSGKEADPDREYGGMTLVRRDSIAAVLEAIAEKAGVAWRGDHAEFEIEPGKTYPAEKMNVKPEDLEASLNATRIFPKAPDFKEEGCGRIGLPIEIDGDLYAVLSASMQTDRVVYRLVGLESLDSFGGTVTTWKRRWDDSPSGFAPEDVSTIGVEVTSPAGEEFVLLHETLDGFFLDAPRPATEGPENPATIPGILKVGDRVQLGRGGGVFPVVDIRALPVGQYEIVYEREAPAVLGGGVKLDRQAVRVVGKSLESANLFFPIFVNPPPEYPSAPKPPATKKRPKAPKFIKTSTMDTRDQEREPAGVP